MADEREIIVEACSLVTLACSLATASLIVKIKKKTLHVGEKVHPRGRQQYGECNALLRELAASEVVKCVHIIIICEWT